MTMKEDYQAFLGSTRNVDECTLREAFEAGYLAGQASAEARVKVDAHARQVEAEEIALLKMAKEVLGVYADHSRDNNFYAAEALAAIEAWEKE